MRLELTRDLEALRDIAAGVEHLRERMLAAQREVAARQRGYLLADEDDRIRRLFLAYRNYRIALLEIIYHHVDFVKAEDPVERDEGFVLALGAATMLYNWSYTLVHTYKDVPVIRAKLNEPDSRFGIESGLFDTIYGSLTSLHNLVRMRDAVALYELHREHLRETLGKDPGLSWLLGQIERQYPLLKRHDVDILRDRVTRGWESWRSLARKPFADVSYQLTTLVMDIFGNLWLGGVPEIPPAHQEQFEALLEPGDFFIVRPERKSSTVFLPGWWTHCTLYHGGMDKLRALGADRLPYIRRAWSQLEARGPVTIEALAAGIVLNTMPDSLHVDHAVAIRPLLGEGDRLAALDDAFSHLGKPYDFEFDFSRSDRLVCTELIYRSFHGKGAIRFEPTLRFGRPTVSADDIADAIIAGLESANPPFEVVAISRHSGSQQRSRFHVGAQAARLFRATRRE